MEDHGHSSTTTPDQNKDHHVVSKYVTRTYYNRLMPIATKSFANMVKTGNLIDHAIKNGRSNTEESSSKPKRGNFPRKKEGEAQAMY